MSPLSAPLVPAPDGSLALALSLLLPPSEVPNPPPQSSTVVVMS
ncbi:hypothetical protein [Nannocystis sp.]|nr:hypothetical protein [Nannocystis sp.]